MTAEQYQIFVSQHYRWHMMIEEEWGGMQRTNLPRDFLLVLLITSNWICMKPSSFVIRVLGEKTNPAMKTIAVTQGFQ